MDEKTAGGVGVSQEHKVNIIDGLAAQIYYAEGKRYRGSGDDKKLIQFEQLAEEDRKKFADRAGSYLMMIGKMNLSIVPYVDPKESEEKRLKNLTILSEIIKSFVSKLKTTKPALFPHDELASWILEGRRE